MVERNKNEYAIEINSISKSYPIEPVNKSNPSSEKWKIFKKALFKKNGNNNEKSFFALNNISLKIDKSESLGIVGLNGSGKSTLMQIIAGTLKPNSGHIKINGKVSALLELGSGFNPDFTGKENVIINGKILGLTEYEIKSKLRSIQNFAEIGDFFHQAVSTYSSGMVLRLAFAVLANTNPDILIIDEALAVGDAKFQLKCFTFLEEFKNKGGTLILVSHDLNSIARLCSHSILLHKGSLLASGKPIDVINIYSKMITDVSTVDIKKFSEVVTDGTEIINYDSPKKFNYGGQLGKIKSVQMNLDNSSVIRSGDCFKISFEAQSYSDIKYPIFALRIRDNKGIEIYGTNTKLQKTIINSLKHGDLVKVEFTSKANLGAGKYFISLGFTCLKDNELKVIHRLREYMDFEVLGSECSFGISNCFSEIVVEHV